MKYYAVVIGHKPGIYTDWKTTEKMVKGFPGSIYKSFTKYDDAQNFISNSTISITPENKTVVYTDGSYENELCGFGVIVIYGTNKFSAYGRVPQIDVSMSNNIAELYAIYVGLSLIEGDAVVYSDSRYAISSLTTYIHEYIKKEWKDVINRSILEAIYLKMRNRNISFQHVYGHKGITLNIEVDKLAKQGRLQEKDLIVMKNDECIT